MTKSWQYLPLAVILALGGTFLSASSVLAQSITIDGTLSPAQTLTGPSYTIPQSVGQTVGSNLFQSFGRFNLNMGERANFESAGNIRNILSRVTGGSASLIDGLIFSNSANVNLFLINPSGIVFGPNARLDVGGSTRGSFVATTVDALVWSNGSQFSATNPGGASSLLTIVGDPSGFLASVRPPQPLTISGSSLSVANNQSLLFLGGNLSLDGATLQAAGGQIELAGMGEARTVGLNVNGNNLSLNFPEGVARQDIVITDNSSLDVVARGGGNINIYARNLDILDSSLTAGINSGSTLPGSQAGDITLDTTEQTRIGQNSIVANFIQRGTTGNSGNINIKARSLLLSDGAGVGAFVFGRGNAGKVFVQASDFVSLTGRRTILDSTIAEAAEGQGGEINIQTGSLSLSDDAQIGTITAGRGNAGKVVIQADSVSLSGNLTGILSNVTPDAVGQGGEINIQTRSLSLTNNAGITGSTLGQGNAGNIFVLATDSVSLSNGTIVSRVDSEANGVGGNINITTGSFSLSQGAAVANDTAGKGNAGNITIRADSVSLVDDSALFAGTSGQGNAGNISVQANNTIFLSNSNIFTVVEDTGIGRAGEINLTAKSISLEDASFISSSTFGNGDSRNIFIQASDAISLANSSGIVTGVRAGAVGNGGDISLVANSLSLTDGGQLFAATFGNGNAGNIDAKIADAINISGVGTTTGFSSGLLTNTESGAIGEGGNIKVAARTLQVSEGGVLSALTRSAFKGGSITVDTNTLAATNGGQIITSAFSSGDAGNVTVNATQRITLSGSNSSFFNQQLQFDQTDAISPASGLFANTESNSTGKGGTIALNTGNLTITDGAGIGINSNGFGSAGELLSINARDAIALDNGVISSQLGRQAEGRGGAINLQTRSLLVTNNAQVTASTFGKGDAGNITLIADIAQATKGGQFRSSTASGNNAGNITFKVRDQINLTGEGSGLFAITEANSTGNGGSIFVSPQTLTLRNGARIAVDSQGSGEGGNIQIQAGRVNLDNRAVISAQTASNQGGDITLQLQELLLLRRNSQISTNAGTDEAGGNGGNININAPFIIAVPEENSDITANAFSGNGGTVRINAQGIFGIQSRQQPTSQSDITASSTGGGINGVVDINTLEIDPSRGFINLPTNVVNTSTLVAQSCSAFGKGGSEFTVTGRGGLPLSPDDYLSSDVVWSDTRLTALPVEPNSRVMRSVRKTADGVAIIPATGWVFDEKKGEVTLIAANASSEGVGSNQVKCAVP